LASVAADGALTLRDAATHRAVLSLQMPVAVGGGIKPRVAFSPDGRRLAAAWPDGMGVWDATGEK
jgi:hypothetical protein